MMMVNSYAWRRVRYLSDAEIMNFSWQDLAVKYIECLDGIEVCERAVAERVDRNKILKQPRYPDLSNREDRLRWAKANERRIRSEIRRRNCCEWLAAGIKINGAAERNVVPFVGSG